MYIEIILHYLLYFLRYHYKPPKLSDKNELAYAGTSPGKQQ